MPPAKALVAGNGESRLSLNLSVFKSHFVLFGCNAVYRDNDVDYLICCDRRMVKEFLKSEKTDIMKVYTRPEWSNMFDHSGVSFLPDIPYKGDERQDQPRHWGSGPYALLLASNMGFDEITLIGFDLYGNDTMVNNVYKGTENYQGVNTNAVNPSYWIYQIAKVFEYYSNVKFNVIASPEWRVPKSWRFSNVSFKKTIDL